MGCTESKTKSNIKRNISLKNTFKGKNFFITGGTGYLGKITIDKLLRSYPDIGKIYVMVRAKGNLTAKQNFEENLLNSLLIKNLDESKKNKLQFIEGDISRDYLGISDRDKSLLATNINYVIHLAAQLDFNAPLKDNTKTNVAATLQLYDMVKASQKFEHFLYVSTIFCNGDQDQLVEERIYDYKDNQDPQEIYNRIMNNNLTKQDEKSIIGNIPNSYCYTKNLCEKLLKVKQKQSNNSTITIFRPSIVLCVNDDPLPGYIDQLIGLGVVHYYVGTGQLQYFYINKEYHIDCITGDATVAQLIMALGVLSDSNKLHIINSGSTNLNPLKNYLHFDICQQFWKENKTLKQKKDPQCDYIFDFNEVMEKYEKLKQQIEENDKLDAGAKKQIFSCIEKLINLNYVYKNINKKQMTFESKLVYEIYPQLSQEDKEILKQYDVRNIDWDNTIKLFQYGIQKYLLKEKNVQFPLKQKQNIMGQSQKQRSLSTEDSNKDQ